VAAWMGLTSAGWPQHPFEQNVNERNQARPQGTTREPEAQPIRLGENVSSEILWGMSRNA